ncbi:hypothetical protein B0A55_06998 [Friedmanniomyces simplex]|uniref:Uncharacterized protein n=1 Tax=Friedmanniomyces simplex TaxID=329884 RepID=A0A4U0X2Y6_9PEZI|nr:hypothetical protein B0A55_06998 [Friedmanniomyces simplex]
MTQFHHKVHEEKSYRRAIFLAVSLALAGVCSVYPVMCFKNYSTKEKDKLNSKVAQVERKAEDAEEPDLQGMAEKHNEEADSPPKTPASVSSSKSKSSNASSFAYLLRNNRADTRLLHKKSQPAAHLTKHTPLARKPVMPQRSPSYYKPKVVEDTLLPDVPSSTLRQQRQTASLTVAEFIKAADVPTIKVEALPEQKNFHNVTPPEAEPTTPSRSHFQHGDHYFHADMPAVVPDGQMVPAVPVTSNPGPRARFISMDRDEYHQSKATGTGTVHWLPHEGQHIRSPPENHPAAKAEGKRRSTFKRLLEDLRHTASVGSFKSEADTPGPAAIGQRGSILQHGSMATLLAKASKSSLNLLQSKASQVTVTSARRRESRERPELRVTNFHQTPYSQRVANTRRTELNQIKAYVEEALLDDDDDTIMGFELNVPDHLPSSPLCPLNPNHKRVGKAICPIHGRKKVRTPGLSKAKTMAASKSGGPRIVYEGVAGEADRRDTQVAGVDGGTSPRGKGETWYS